MSPIPKIHDSNINNDNNTLIMSTPVIITESDSDSWVSDTSSFDDLDPNDDIYKGYEIISQTENKNGYHRESEEDNEQTTADDFIIERNVEVDDLVRAILDSDISNPSNNFYNCNDLDVKSEVVQDNDNDIDPNSYKTPETNENNFADFTKAYGTVILLKPLYIIHI